MSIEQNNTSTNAAGTDMDSAGGTRAGTEISTATESGPGAGTGAPAAASAGAWPSARRGCSLVCSGGWRALCLAGKTTLVLYFVFCAMVLVLRYGVLPNIDHYKPQIERAASGALGQPVAIAAIEASWRGLNPSLSLRDVQILDRQGVPALRLPLVSATLSWLSVPLASLRLQSLEINRPELRVSRDASGRVFVAGIDIADPRRKQGGGLDWLLSQREIVIRNGVLHWEDGLRHAEPLTLSALDLVLQNAWNSHSLGLRATPPARFGAPLDVRARFSHGAFASITDFTQWSGTLYADWQGADLTAWKPYVDYPVELRQGAGAVRAWLDFRLAAVTALTADLQLADLTTRLRPDLEPLALKRVDGRIGFSQPQAQAQAQVQVQRQPQSGPAPQSDWKNLGQHGYTLALQDFSLETADGLTLPSTNASHVFVPATGARAESNLFTATAVDLRTVSDFAARLPLSDSQRQMVSDYQPRGRLADVRASWSGSYPAIDSYAIKGNFQALGLQGQPPRALRAKSAGVPAQAAIPGIPGFDNLDGSIDASERGGKLSLDSRQVVLQLPGYFSDPVLPLQKLVLAAKWSFDDQQRYVFQIDDLDIANDDMQLGLSARQVIKVAAMKENLPERVRQKTPGNLKVSGRIAHFDIGRIGRYLPLQTPEHLREWLAGALVSGQARDVSIEVDGELADFPFRPAASSQAAPAGQSGASVSSSASTAVPASSAAQPAQQPLARTPTATTTAGPARGKPGRFLVSGKIDQGVLNYLPGNHAADGKAPLWPLLEAIEGSFVFDRTRMHIKAGSALTNGVALSEVDAVIADLADHDHLLEISGTGNGSLQNFLGYTVASPVAGWIGHFTEESRAAGDARLELKLAIPLAHPLESKVTGLLRFAGNELTLMNLLPPLSQTVGELSFNEKGFDLNGVKAQFLGGPVAVTGGSQQDGSIAVRADGTLSADGLRRQYATPALRNMTQRISGAARYSATVKVRNKHPEVLVESSLYGLGLDFPAPLRKSAADSLPLKFEMLPVVSDDASQQRDEFNISLGSSIAARYARKKGVERTDPWVVERAGIGVNVPPTLPDSGLIANVSMKTLDLDAWREAMGQGGGAPVAGAANAAGTAAGPAAGNPADAGRSGVVKPAQDDPGLAQYIEPEVLAARTTELIVMGKKLNNVVVGASHQGGLWQANIDSEEASGYISWSEPRNGRGPGLATARLTSLSIPKSATTEVSTILEGKSTTTEMPNLDIVADKFELSGKQLGKLQLLANNAVGTAGREWRISKLMLSNEDAVLNARGKWNNPGADSSSSLDYRLDISDAGKLLERFGFGRVVHGGKGNMEGEVSWKGLPFALDIPSLNGELRLDLESGQFLKVDPAAAKLLGVLSLQSLPRRLALDFRDLFSEGFAFDGVLARANINNGVMSTDNFKMRSLSAVVLMNGTVDIARESQDLHVVVLPEVNVGAASVVYGLMVNPVIGLGTFLAQLFLRDPLMQAFTMEYEVSGPWKEPQVRKLARSPVPQAEARLVPTQGR